MDSLTQIVLGASVGELLLGKKAGNKAILWGAITGTVPDLDVLSRNFMHIVDSMSIHRGFTHSILFCILFAPLFGWMISKLHKSVDASWKEWSILAFWCFLTHSLLDCCTTWGTQLFWPADYRVSLQSIFVIDPLYTIPFLVCVVWPMFYKKDSRMRSKLNATGLILSTSYLLFTFVNKQVINHVFEDAFVNQHMNVLRYETKPAPLNNILWSATAETEDGYFIGYYSYFDSQKEISFRYYEKNHHLLNKWPDRKLHKVLHLTNGWFTVEKTENGLLINDLRFGQRTGWANDPDDEFVFAYLLKDGDISQRPTSFNGFGETIGKLWKRILGN